MYPCKQPIAVVRVSAVESVVVVFRRRGPSVVVSLIFFGCCCSLMRSNALRLHDRVNRIRSFLDRCSFCTCCCFFRCFGDDTVADPTGTGAVGGGVDAPTGNCKNKSVKCTEGRLQVGHLQCSLPSFPPPFEPNEASHRRKHVV